METRLVFTDKEVLIIKAAEKKAKSAKLLRIIIFVVLCAAVVAFFFNMISQQVLVCAAFGGPIYALLITQIGPGPKYEQLVLLLGSKLRNE